MSGGRRRPPGTLTAGVIMLAVIALLAAFGPLIWGQRAAALGVMIHGGPSLAHPLGTDALGRDLLARTLAATRLTIVMACLATLIAVGSGTLYGAALVLAGPRARAAGERLIDLMLAFPPVIAALAITAIFRPSQTSVLVAIGLAFMPQFARMANKMAASVRGMDYVTVAYLLGLRPWRLLRRHVLPNIAGPLLVLTSVGFSAAVLTLSGLSFIGLGVQEPSYDWGQLLAHGLQDLGSNPVEAAGPALCILLTGLAAGLTGDGLTSFLDPRRSVRSRRRGSSRHARPAAADPAGDTGTVVSVRDLRIETETGVGLVRSVSMDIGPGEIVGLVGESGSGKTLTAMAIAGLLPAGLTWSAGRLRVTGQDMSDPRRKPPRTLATRLGVVFQDPSSSFNPARHIGPQITEAARVHGGMREAQAATVAIGRLREVRVSAPELRMRQYPHELSGGMRQRAMIAMALMTGPDLLIADEPTTALDVTVQADVLRLLRDLNQAHGMAILLISHDINVVSALCHRVRVMYAGQVVEELLAADLHRRRVWHPYTRALLDAAPRLSRDAPDHRLTPLPGGPPANGDVRSGCAFAARCPLAVPDCAKSEPPLRPAGDGRLVACHVATGPLGEPAAGPARVVTASPEGGRHAAR